MKNFRGQSFKQSINIETVFQCKVLVKYVARNLCLKQSDWRQETNQNAGNSDMKISQKPLLQTKQGDLTCLNEITLRGSYANGFFETVAFNIMEKC